MAEQPREKEFLAQLTRVLYVVGAACASTLMVLLFALAFWEIGKAVAVFMHLAVGPDSRVPPESQAIMVALKGIEYLFLAPMSFLVYRSLANYVVERARGGSGTSAEEEVTETKRLVTSLMFAVVATDLIGRVLSPEGLLARPPIYELCLLVILAAYMFLLHRMRSPSD
jgi:hypothetical protein